MSKKINVTATVSNPSVADAFLEEVEQFVAMKYSINDIDKAVILFTASIEIGSKDIGFGNMLATLNELISIASNEELDMPSEELDMPSIWSGKDNAVH